MYTTDEGKDRMKRKMAALLLAVMVVFTTAGRKVEMVNEVHATGRVATTMVVSGPR
jgi:hypothetical protein